jgi:hypothetical protein
MLPSWNGRPLMYNGKPLHSLRPEIMTQPETGNNATPLSSISHMFRSLPSFTYNFPSPNQAARIFRMQMLPFRGPLSSPCFFICSWITHPQQCQLRSIIKDRSRLCIFYGLSAGGKNILEIIDRLLKAPHRRIS